MPSSWSYPTIVTQYCEADVHVPWLNIGSEFDQINFVRTEKDLRHISNPLVNDMKMKTYFLKLTGFSWDDLPETVTGIEAYIDIRRTGRITDETIKLCIDGQATGSNLGTADLSNIKTYGGEDSLWGLETLNISKIDENFGLILRYQSHPSWPHQTTPNLEHIQIRVW